MKRHLTAAVCVLMLLAADKADDKPSELTGTWELIAQESAGQADPDVATLKLKLTFLAGGKWSLAMGESKLNGSFSADAKTSPKSVDFTTDNDPANAKARKAIYAIDGDTLKICEPSSADNPRPTKFASTKAGGEDLLTFKRIKP